MILKAIAIDDEVLALQKIERFCSQINYIDLLKTFDNPLEAYYFLCDNKIDMLFLDIRMEYMSGIELLGRLEEPPYTILTTAFSQYSLKAFDLDVVDYLLKPIRPDRFKVATDKVLDRVKKDIIINSEEAKISDTDNKYIFLKSGYKTQKVFLSDILYIEGMRDYLSVKTYRKSIVVLMTFEKILEMLPCDKFIRIHRSYIVAFNKINSYSSREVQIKDRVLPVSKTYSKEFTDRVAKTDSHNHINRKNE